MNITLTESSTKYLKNFIKHNQKIHIGIKSTGCSGFQYILDAINSNDSVDQYEENFKINEIPFVIARKHIPYLQDLNIDYVKEGINKKIIYKNPNASAICGCGTSFSI